MGLSRKTLCYSMILSVTIVLCLVGYFVWMLPSLYVAHMQMQNYNSAVQLQEDFIRERSYAAINVKNPMNAISIEIPFEDNTITVSGKFFEGSLKVEDEEFLKFLDKIRYYVRYADEIEDWEMEDMDFTFLSNIFENKSISQDNSLQVRSFYNEDNSLFQTTSKAHLISSDLIVFESSIADGASGYSSYVAVGNAKDDIVITMVFTVTPEMKEIKPVVMSSIPMIVAVAFLLVLISSQIFSRFIINPIIRLASHAKIIKETEMSNFTPVIVKGNDEISSLGDTLNELYEKLLENKQELEEKNSYLAKENKAREVYLRASSHQLKTPVSAALLLTDGMLHEVGKYKDTKRYLPQLKEQLRSIQKIIEDILQMNPSREVIKTEAVYLNDITEKCIGNYMVIIAEKNLTIKRKGTMEPVKTDKICMEKILDNIISNAVLHTPDNEIIEVIYEKNEFFVINYGITIAEELLPHIFEPFVTSNTGQKGHGLGLYVAAYYSQLLGCKITINNFETGVEARITFP